MNQVHSPSLDISPHLTALKRAAAATGVSPKVFLSASRVGDIPISVHKVAGRNFVVTSALHAWLSAHKPVADKSNVDLF